MRRCLGFGVLALALAACTGASGTAPRITSLASDSGATPAGVCQVRAGDFMYIKGENFGTAADWTAKKGKVVFRKDAAVLGEAASAELTQAEKPATLVLKVPSAVNPGPNAVEAAVVVEMGAVVSNPYPVVILPPLSNTGVGPQVAVPGCEPLPSPPAP